MKNCMKQIVFAAALGVAAALASCVGRQVVVEAESQRDSLATVVSAKDSLINAVFADINAISENLALIKSRENLITVAGEAEGGRRPVEEINNDIAAIDRLLRENKDKIASLQRSAALLRKSNLRIESLEKMIADMNAQLGEKSAEVDRLRERLAQMGVEVESLSQEVAVRSAEVENLSGEKIELQNQLNTVYYIVGAEKELRDAQIINKPDADGGQDWQSGQFHGGRFAPAVGDSRRTEKGFGRHVASRGFVSAGDSRRQGRREIGHYRSRALLGNV